jgi:hypothetical protein
MFRLFSRKAQKKAESILFKNKTADFLHKQNDRHSHVLIGIEQNKTKQRDRRKENTIKESEMRKFRSLSSRERIILFSFFHAGEKNHSTLNARSEKIISVKFKIF